jgi:hypothetical protein
MRPSAVAEPPMTADGVNATASAFLHDQDPDRTSLIKTKFFVGAIGRDLADPPGAPFPDHPQ